MICDPYDMQIADDLYVAVPCFYVFLYCTIWYSCFYLQSLLFTYIQCRVRVAPTVLVKVKAGLPVCVHGAHQWKGWLRQQSFSVSPSSSRLLKIFFPTAL
jgi:hypothetical protein